MAFKPHHSSCNSPIPLKVFGALIFILIGIVFSLKNMNLLSGIDIWKYWPVLFIIFALMSMFYKQYIQSFIHLILGILLLSHNLGYISLKWSHVWPILLIILGVILLKHVLFYNKLKEEGKVEDDLTNMIKLEYFMGGGETKNSSQNFKGGSITTFMGGTKIDLRKARIKTRATIDIVAFWGGVELIVPRDWQIQVSARQFLGGVGDRTDNPIESERNNANDSFQSKPVLEISGTLMMGGVEIKN
ncbi:MAG: DUF5668 domain-containing protein [Deltaproteobacteria bacterium]|jgi:predicted membrane protein|nr:DUF5668 domain-containing protein [Deltaproteobacteria bacterium]